MARESTVTQEQVNAVANALQGAGEKPTPRKVRAQLGSGSMTTVLKYFQNWQASHTLPVVMDVALPTTLSKHLMEFVAQEKALSRAQVEEELVMMQQSQTDLVAENERNEATIEELTGELERFQTENAELTGRVAQLESEQQRLRDEIRAAELAAEAARTDLATVRIQVATLPQVEAEVVRLKADLESCNKIREEAERTAAVMSAKVEAAEARAVAGEGREKALIEKVGRQEEQVNRINEELKTAQLKATESQARGEAALREKALLEQSLQQARETIEDQRSREKPAEASKDTKPKPKEAGKS